MTRISSLALIAAMWAFSVPSFAQDPSASGEVSASAEISSQPSAEVSSEEPPISSELSSELSGDVSASAETSASGEASAGFDFDIDVYLSIDFSYEHTIEFRKIVVEENVQPVAGEVTFDVAVGSTVPATVTLSPLPVRIVQLIPAFEGYLFFLLPDGRIVVVSPTTLKVVLIIYA
jgi:hypothetical protein